MPRRIILVLSAVAALLLGLEKVGVFQFVPAGDVGFEWTAQRLPDGRATLVLRSDAGDLSCWIRLVIRWVGPDSGEFDVSISSGEPLVVSLENIGAAQREVGISKAPDPQQRTPFVWRAGLPIQLVLNGPSSGTLMLEDWSVHAVAQPSDSRAKAQWRTWWTRCSWVLLAFAIIGAAVTAWPRKEEPEVATSLTLVRTIVSTITGSDPQQTVQLRSFLRKVLLESVPVREALDALKIPSSPYRTRPQFVARARRVFLDRITAVKTELDSFGDRLNAHL